MLTERLSAIPANAVNHTPNRWEPTSEVFDANQPDMAPRHGGRRQAEPESVRRPNYLLSPTSSSERENGRPYSMDRGGQMVAISSSNSLVRPVPAPVSKGTAQTSVAPASNRACIRDRTVLSSPVIANPTGPSTPSRSKRRR